jgi:hypothetical protein
MKRHPLDPLSLVFGLLFTAIALAFLGGDRSVADLGAAWLWPIPIITIGLLMLLYGAKRLFRHEPLRDPDVDDGEDASP